MFTAAALFTIAKAWKQPKCPSTDEPIKKMWYVYTMEYYSATKKERNNVICINTDDLEIIILSEVRKRQIPYDITYTWNLKYGTNEPIYKTQTDSQTQRTDLWLPRGGGRGMDWEFGVGRCKLLHTEWINNKVLL